MWKNLYLKKISFHFTAGREIIIYSKGENAGKSVGASLQGMRSDSRGAQTPNTLKEA